VASITDFLGPLATWYTRHCAPINTSCYDGDEAAAREKLGAAWAAWRGDPELDADGQRTLEYVLLGYEYTLIDRFVGTDEARAEQFTLTLSQIEALTPLGPLSDTAQAAHLLTMLGSGTRRGFVQRDPPVVDALLARIPEAARTANLWYYVVAWAYHNNHLRYLEEALAHQTVETTGWQDDYFWLRTNLMYLLVDGRATRLDVEKTLLGYAHPWNFVDFRNLFLVRCEAAGLMDRELYALMEQREAEMSALEGTQPVNRVKTVHAVKQG
jgi:hypothetical protein